MAEPGGCVKATRHCIRQQRSGACPSLQILLNRTELKSWDCGLDKTSDLSHTRSVTTLGFIYMELTVKFNQRMIPVKKKVKREENQTKTYSCGNACIKGVSDKERIVNRGGNQNLARRTGAIAQWLRKCKSSGEKKRSTIPSALGGHME